MNRPLRLIASLALAFWLGGLATLFCFATAYFAHDRALATKAVPVLFQTFATYHLVAAGVALAAVVLARVLAPRIGARQALALIILVGIGTACAIGSTLVLGKMEQLRRDDPHENMMDQPTFRRMHITSNILYTTEALAVLAATITLAWPARRERAAIVSSTTMPGDMAAPRDTSPQA